MKCSGIAFSIAALSGLSDSDCFWQHCIDFTAVELDRPCVDSYYKSYNVMISYEIGLYIDINKNMDLNVLLIKKKYEAIPT